MKIKKSILILFATLFCLTVKSQDVEILTLPLRTKGIDAYQGDKQSSIYELYGLFQTGDCLKSYDSYKYGFKRIKAANILATFGSYLVSSPVLFTFILNNNLIDIDYNIIFLISSICLFYYVTVSILTSIFFYCIEKRQIKYSYEHNNYHCIKSTSMTLNVIMTKNRCRGLSLNF